MAFSIGMWACTNQNKENYVNLDSSKFGELIDSTKNIQVLDVRTDAEYAESHIHDSRNIDVLDSNFALNVEKELNPEYLVAVYCKSGRRSRNAAKILADKGFKVYNLDKGILGWIEDGMPVDK